MARPRLLIVDTCTVIELHEIGLWNAVLANFDVTVTETVQEEARQCTIDGETVLIELGYNVSVVSISASDSAALRARFLPRYIEALHPGETDSLVLLLRTQDHVICSSDAIVYKVLGCLNEGDRCISLEALLNSAGMGRKMRNFWYREDYRKQTIREGQEDAIRGRALK
jgi:hypothetical protein